MPEMRGPKGEMGERGDLGDPGPAGLTVTKLFPSFFILFAIIKAN